MTVAWFTDARKSYKPPSYTEFVGHVAPADDRDAFMSAALEKDDISERTSNLGNGEVTEVV